MSQLLNADIKQMMRERNIRQWQIAKALNIHESVLSRKIAREKLTGELRESVIEAIEKLSC